MISRRDDQEAEASRSRAISRPERTASVSAVFFSAAAWHRDYHMVSDEAQYVAYDRLESISRYVGDLVLAVANLDYRPIVDKPKPDPNGTCVQ